MAVVINGDTGITTVNGTAAAPSITGTDTDTGIVYGTNTLSLVTGGTTAATVSSSQDVALAAGLTVTGAATVGSLGVTGAATAASMQVNGIGTNLYPLVSGTTVASTSGTSIDFTGIPSWVKRVTVMFNGVSTTSTSNLLIQSGSGSIETTGYVSQAANRGGEVSSTTGFVITTSIAAASLMGGAVTLTTLGSNIWTDTGVMNGGNAIPNICAGYKTFSGVIDRIRITTVLGTATFDAGSINILYE